MNEVNDVNIAEMVPHQSKISHSDDEEKITNRATPAVHQVGEDTSQMNKDEKMEYYKLMTLVWISRAIPIVAALGAMGYLIWLIANSDNWKTNEGASGKEITDRETKRGVFVSIVIAFLLNIIGAFMFYIKVKEHLVVTNYGFVLGPVIGFMLDQGIGKDDGFRDFMTSAGFSYTFSSLISGNFARYIITIFLDLFISNPLQDVLKSQAIELGVIEVLNNPRGKKYKYGIAYDLFVAMNYPSILQSIIAFITFNAYTNQTRFKWAYPDNDVNRELRIPPGTIMLSTAIAGVLYLNFYTIMDYISDREYFDINTKLIYVILILGLLYGLNQTDSIEAPVKGEYDVEYTKSISAAKPYLGMLMFAGFVLYGFVYPVYTRLGICGRWKPKNQTFDEPINATIRIKQPKYNTAYARSNPLTKEMIDEIKRQIKHELKDMP